MNQLTQYYWYHRRNRHLALIRATVIQHPPFKWARNSFCEWNGIRTRPFGPVAIHSTPRNFRTSAEKSWLNGLRPRPSQPHLCFCLLTRVWLLYFIRSTVEAKKITLKLNLVPRVSHLTASWSERRETLVGSGHVSPRIWEMTIKLLRGWAT